jgi:hypothetical protein
MSETKEKEKKGRKKGGVIHGINMLLVLESFFSIYSCHHGNSIIMSMVKSNVGSNNYVQTKFIDDLIHF